MGMVTVADILLLPEEAIHTHTHTHSLTIVQ